MHHPETRVTMSEIITAALEEAEIEMLCETDFRNFQEITEVFGCFAILTKKSYSGQRYIPHGFMRN
jgi:hypothetical protein